MAMSREDGHADREWSCRERMVMLTGNGHDES